MRASVLKDELSAYYQRLLGQRVRGRYELLRFLKAGGSSGVYEGVDRVMDRRVAIKVLYGTNPMMTTRFEREAMTLSRLRHPNTLTVYDFGHAEDGFLYMVMEYLEGRTLKDLLRAEGRLHARRVVAIASQVCRSLAEAHRQGVVHRDIKPSNVCLVSVDGNPEFVKVLDFGVAKVLHASQDPEQEHTQMGRIIGTPRYMSPEQIGSTELDGRADLYSLGILVYEMLAGEVPFNDPSLASLLLMHLRDAPPTLARHGVTDAPAGLEDVLFKCLAKRPDDRFATADAFRQALEAAVGFTTEWSLAAFAATELPSMVQQARQAQRAVPEPPPVPEDSAHGSWGPLLNGTASSGEVGLDDIDFAEPVDDFSVAHAPQAPVADHGASQSIRSVSRSASLPAPGVQPLPASAVVPPKGPSGLAWAAGGAMLAGAGAALVWWIAQPSPSSHVAPNSPTAVAVAQVKPAPAQLQPSAPASPALDVASAPPAPSLAEQVEASPQAVAQAANVEARGPQDSPPAPEAPPQTPKGAAIDAPAQFRAQVRSSPEGAEVWAGERLLGHTPLTLEEPLDAIAHVEPQEGSAAAGQARAMARLDLRLAGHLPGSIDVHAFGQQEPAPSLHVKLDAYEQAAPQGAAGGASGASETGHTAAKGPRKATAKEQRARAQGHGKGQGDGAVTLDQLQGASVPKLGKSAPAPVASKAAPVPAVKQLPPPPSGGPAQAPTPVPPKPGPPPQPKPASPSVPLLD